MKSIPDLRLNETPRMAKVPQVDSVEKILSQLAYLTPWDVHYEGRTMFVPVDKVVLAPQFFDRFTCVNGCTACCQKFTLDYLPEEFELVPHKEGFSERQILVNGAPRRIFTNDQSENSLCDFLTVKRLEGGLGCAQWPFAPLSCRSAPQIKFTQEERGKTLVTSRPFNMKKWNLQPLPQCQFSFEMDSEDAHNKILLLDRFRLWSIYFDVHTCLLLIIQEVERVLKSGVKPIEEIVIWERR